MKTARLLFLVMLLLACFVVVVSCGGGGGGGGNTGTLQPPLYNASGTWDITETSKNGNCPVPAPTESYSISVNHPAGSNNLVVTALDTNMTYNGTISGSAVNYAGPSIDANCPGGISLSVTLSLSSDTYLSGSANWTCNYNTGSCTGTTAFNGTKAKDTTLPTAPTGLTGSAVSSSQINLSWSASTDNVGVTGYRLERCQGVSCSNFAEIATPATTSFSNISLLASTSYSYRVRAVDAAGNLSGYSNTFSATTQAGGGGGDTTPPTAPTGLTGSAVSTSQINLSWTASTDNVGVSGYKVYGDDHINITPLWFIKNVTGTSTSMTGLIAAAEYCYRVSAFDAAGNESLYSNQFCATTQSAGPTTVTLYATRDAEIAWSDASNSVANTNYGNNPTMELGNYFLWGAYVSSYMKTGILVDFTFEPATWAGKTITSAKLRLYVWDYAVQPFGQYVAYKIVDTMIGGNYQYPWTETGVTWNNAPTYFLTSTSTAYAPLNPTQYTEWNVTSMVQEWFTSGTMGNGIIILDMNAPPSIYYTTNQITTYYSRNHATQALRPQLIITY